MAEDPKNLDLSALMTTLQLHADQITRINESIAAQATHFAKAAEVAKAHHDALAKSFGGPMIDSLRSFTINRTGVLHLTPITDASTSEQLRRSLGKLQLRLPASLAAKVRLQTDELRGFLDVSREALAFEKAAASAAHQQIRLNRGMVDALSRLAESVAIDQSLHADRTLTASIRAVIEEIPHAPAAGTKPAVHETAALAPEATLDELKTWLSTQPAAIQWIVFLAVWFLAQLAVSLAVDTIRDKWLDSKDPESINLVINEVHQYNISPDVVDLRCVNGKGVRVRSGPSAEHDIVGRLVPGHPVEVTETRGMFAHILYRDTTSGDLRDGWAATNYLVKMVCKPKD